jgi:kynurenine formamidase
MTRSAIALLVVVLSALTAVPGAPKGQTIGLIGQRIVDLTHAFGPRTLYWPTSPSRFKLDSLASGQTPGGFFYAANTLSTPEHGGTHLDAPVHFAERGRTVADIPLEQLVAPAVVIDIVAKAAADRDYRLSIQDVAAFESQHGAIARGAIVLLRTGWSRHWPDAKAYLGDDTPNDASKLSFPSYGLDAAKLLIEDRGVAALGIDTASIDYGRSSDFMVHRLAGARNVPGLENLTSLDRLPARGAIVIALPMKIEGGSGAPLRAIAIIP